MRDEMRWGRKVKSWRSLTCLLKWRRDQTPSNERLGTEQKATAAWSGAEQSGARFHCQEEECGRACSEGARRGFVPESVRPTDNNNRAKRHESMVVQLLATSERASTMECTHL